jgi:predicted hydrolase (HD superfamily)
VLTDNDNALCLLGIRNPSAWNKSKIINQMLNKEQMLELMLGYVPKPMVIPSAQLA